MRHFHWLLPALLGWYLVLPSYRCPDLTHGPEGCVNRHLPMSQWHFDTFETLRECEAIRNYINGHTQEMVARIPPPRPSDDLHMNMEATYIALREYHDSMCVASDDPRLKE